MNACPEQAIQVELVNIAEWRADFSAANAPGMPPAEHTISTTRITLPDKVLPGIRAGRLSPRAPEDPHWPLVAMLVLTQLSAGAFLYLSLVAGGAAARRDRGAGRGVPLAGRLDAAPGPADSCMAGAAVCGGDRG